MYMKKTLLVISHDNRSQDSSDEDVVASVDSIDDATITAEGRGHSIKENFSLGWQKFQISFKKLITKSTCSLADEQYWLIGTCLTILQH